MNSDGAGNDGSKESTAPPIPAPPRLRRWRRAMLIVAGILLLGLLLPAPMQIPVESATTSAWNPRSFWFEPWGLSGVHKGIDIFAPKGRDVTAACAGVVVYTGELAQGGRVVLVLGARWRVHYYAHLDTIDATIGQPVRGGTRLGSVGDSGNARGKPPHLHYSVLTLLPYPWRWDRSTQGWRKMFYLDPGALLSPAES
jgi:murein DD-endopeptidase MepM/ murein hydrolase activator NlpD